VASLRRPASSRTAQALFAALTEAGEEGVVVEVAMLEIYCDAVRDLLGAARCSGENDEPAEEVVTGCGAGSPGKLEVSGLGAGQLPRFQERMPGLRWVRVANAEETLVRFGVSCLMLMRSCEPIVVHSMEMLRSSGALAALFVTCY
jgi:hypothetical protein